MRHFRQIIGLVLIMVLSSGVYSVDQVSCGATESYQNHVDLIDGGGFRFYWNVTKKDNNASDLTGEVRCRTQGWVSFGLTPTGHMTGSDVFVAWFQQNGTVNFTDRHILPKDQVQVDSHQDWILLESKQADGVSTYKFRRPIVLNNTEDMSITTGANKLIFAWSNTTPQPGGDIQYHQTNRGSIQIVFFN